MTLCTTLAATTRPIDLATGYRPDDHLAAEDAYYARHAAGLALPDFAGLAQALRRLATDFRAGLYRPHRA